MGISGLPRALKTIMERKHLQDLSGQSAAVDALGWLHRGTYCCSTEICVNADWSKCISYCMKRVEMLRHFGVKPIMVFDGDNLPMKKDTEKARQQSRKEALVRGYKLYQEGRGAEAQQEFIKAVDVTPAMIRSLIDRLEASGVDFVVAPYEADAQLAYLQRQGKVDFVISEDSDCIAFGCDRVLFKLDNEGFGDYFDRMSLGTNKQLAMKTFTHDMVLDMCILAGCDYLDSLPGMGIVRAHKLVHQYRRTERILRGLRFNGKTSVPKDYEARFIRARLTFCHQLVHPYTPGVKNGLVPLTAVDADAVAKLLPLEDRILHFAGPQIDDTVAHHIARGKINAITKIPFADEPAPRPLIKAIESATLAMPSKVSAPGPMDRFLNRCGPPQAQQMRPGEVVISKPYSRRLMAARSAPESINGESERKSRHFANFIESKSVSSGQSFATSEKKSNSSDTCTAASQEVRPALRQVSVSRTSSKHANQEKKATSTPPRTRCTAAESTVVDSDTPSVSFPQQRGSSPQDEWHDVAEDLSADQIKAGKRFASRSILTPTIPTTTAPFSSSSPSPSSSSSSSSPSSSQENFMHQKPSSIDTGKRTREARHLEAQTLLEENIDRNARSSTPVAKRGDEISTSPGILSLGSGIKPTPSKRPRMLVGQRPSSASSALTMVASPFAAPGAKLKGPKSPRTSPNPFRAFTFSSAELRLDASP